MVYVTPVCHNQTHNQTQQIQMKQIHVNIISKMVTEERVELKYILSADVRS